MRSTKAPTRTKSLFSDFPVLIICCLHTRGFVSADLTICFSHRLNVSHNSSFHIYPTDGWNLNLCIWQAHRRGLKPLWIRDRGTKLSDGTINCPCRDLSGIYRVKNGLNPVFTLLMNGGLGSLPQMVDN